MEDKKKYNLFTLKLGTLNIISIILLITMILLTYIIIDILNINIKFELTNMNIGIIGVTYIFYMILHELFHSISYIIHGASHNKITFGIHIEKGIMCCLCKQNITKRNILNSLLYPLFYLGVITYIIGFIIKSPLLITLSILNISGCSGDIIMFLYFIRLKDFEYTEYDDPISFAIYTNADLSKSRPFGLKYIKPVESVERTDLKKLKISKFSAIFLILLIICSIILLTIK